jgi:hypothetical protein
MDEETKKKANTLFGSTMTDREAKAVEAAEAAKAAAPKPSLLERLNPFAKQKMLSDAIRKQGDTMNRIERMERGE